MRAPTVGVVVPVRGPAPFLAETLSALHGQSSPIDRVVVVDDASDPPVVIGAFREPRTVVRRRESRGGPSGARNTGLSELATEWVGFCDADDVWLADKLASQVRIIEAFPRADVCVGGAVIVGPDGRPTGEQWPALAAGIDGASRVVERLYEANPILLSSGLVRREALLEVGGFDESLTYAEDWDLWLRLAGAGKVFASAPDAKVAYRRHAGGLTADVTRLARAQLDLHRRYGHLVSPAARQGAEHRDLLALADGLMRDRQWKAARVSIQEAGNCGPIPRRHTVRRAISAVPGVRRLLGRGSPYAGRGGWRRHLA